ncbi:adenylate kinase [Paenibacillus sp. ACRRX]|uniref:adenylate kinase n=1 Tax=Paenibacillus sp. ACRRX TaxID=2918206 RepID=UPI001EF6AE37|nr:adenylate kinase [Paenibacillus sp. ACRRX]MCG7407716.1 adenylate kinase [Paenibacillus sp. ACRRX]
MRRYANELFGIHGGGKRRELYQWFGQAMRERDPDIWVRKCFDSIETYRSFSAADYYMYGEKTERAVISDLRQPSEYDRCRTEGFVIIRVTAPDGIRIQRAIESGDKFDYADLVHETESHVDSFVVDYEIINDGTLDQLHSQIDSFMEAVGFERIG